MKPVQKKLSTFVLLLLLVRHNCALKCMEGVRIGDVDGYNSIMVPTPKTCTTTSQTCVRLEVEEMFSVYGAPNGELLSDVTVMRCVDDCVSKYENVDEVTKNKLAAEIIAYLGASTYTPGDKGAWASCCSTENCNLEPIVRPEEQTTQPETTQPETTHSETTQPPTVQNSTIQPSTPQPYTTEGKSVASSFAAEFPIILLAAFVAACFN